MDNIQPTETDPPRETNQHRQLTLVSCDTCELRVERREIVATQWGMLCPRCWSSCYNWQEGFKDED